MNPSESSALTCAEQEIVHHVLLGWTNKQIATCRGTSVGTVANQIAAIYQKLGISSRADLLVRFAVSPQEPGPSRPPALLPVLARAAGRPPGHPGTLQQAHRH